MSILRQHKITYFLIPNTDQFPCEMIGEHAKRLEYITGFTGSSATAVINVHGKSIFFTDGRYITQAKKQVSLDHFNIKNVADISVLQWLKDNVVADDRVAYDPRLYTISSIRKYIDVLPMQSLDKNPIDILWQDQPKIPKQRIFSYTETNRDISQKIEPIIGLLEDDEAMLIADPETLSWILNIRATEIIAHTPVVVGYLLITYDSSLMLFTNSSELRHEMDKDIYHFNIKNFSKEVANFSTIKMDEFYTPSHLKILLEKQGIGIHYIKNPTVIQRACKDEVEIKAAERAHIFDGVAVTKFLCWLHTYEGSDCTEILAEEKLLEYRQQNRNFRENSFPTISSFNSNAAIIHYRASAESNMTISGNGIYLVDSGGQYGDATTDITRTVFVGNDSPTEEQKLHYTLVMKGHIEIATACFPVGTRGYQLDILARKSLWKYGLDYQHGTGHGVGSYLSVHEGPQSISSYPNNISLMPGMILSNEPGYYLEGQYGIRIESLLYVIKHPELKNYLAFKNLTLVPMETKLLNYSLLSQHEIDWITEYNLIVFNTISKYLSEEEIKFYQNRYLG